MVLPVDGLQQVLAVLLHGLVGLLTRIDGDDARQDLAQEAVFGVARGGLPKTGPIQSLSHRPREQ